MATFGSRVMQLDIDTLRTMTFVALTCVGQTVFYVIRERKRIWSSQPSWLVILSTTVDGMIVGTLARGGIHDGAARAIRRRRRYSRAIVLALVMDQIKAWLFGRLGLA